MAQPSQPPLETPPVLVEYESASIVIHSDDLASITSAQKSTSATGPPSKDQPGYSWKRTGHIVLVVLLIRLFVQLPTFAFLVSEDYASHHFKGLSLKSWLLLGQVVGSSIGFPLAAVVVSSGYITNKTAVALFCGLSVIVAPALGFMSDFGWVQIIATMIGFVPEPLLECLILRTLEGRLETEIYSSAFFTGQRLGSNLGILLALAFAGLLEQLYLPIVVAAFAVLPYIAGSLVFPQVPSVSTSDVLARAYRSTKKSHPSDSFRRHYTFVLGAIIMAIALLETWVLLRIVFYYEIILGVNGTPEQWTGSFLSIFFGMAASIVAVVLQRVKSNANGFVAAMLIAMGCLSACTVVAAIFSSLSLNPLDMYLWVGATEFLIGGALVSLMTALDRMIAATASRSTICLFYTAHQAIAALFTLVLVLVINLAGFSINAVLLNFQAVAFGLFAILLLVALVHVLRYRSFGDFPDCLRQCCMDSSH